ncbi:hypothetical protein C8R44DRAFT_388753 [Mycena epipterygia]|nr:hypothetical protein C8R44DRAFT_388753 [Mycena epipterygia]
MPVELNSKASRLRGLYLNSIASQTSTRLIVNMSVSECFFHAGFLIFPPSSSIPVRQPSPRYDPRLSPRFPDPPSPSRRHFVVLGRRSSPLHTRHTTTLMRLSNASSAFPSLALPRRHSHILSPSPSPAPALRPSTPASFSFVFALGRAAYALPSTPIRPDDIHPLKSDPIPRISCARTFMGERQTPSSFPPYPPPPSSPSPDPLSRRPLLATPWPPPSTALTVASFLPPLLSFLHACPYLYPRSVPLSFVVPSPSLPT